MSGVTRAWPDGRGGIADVGDRAVVVDVRGMASSGGDLVEELAAIASFLVASFAALTPAHEPAALVVRHDPAASGRLSGSLLGEMTASACRAFVRQLRYDRNWVDVPLTFVDGRDATDAELAALIAAGLAGGARIEVERTSGLTAAYGWERGAGL
jgi:alpha-D-ribose 1-methylphosphonate 5-triphosphate synthase subunit PhnG